MKFSSAMPSTISSPSMDATAPDHALQLQLQRFTPSLCDAPDGPIQYRHSGTAPVHQASIVMLHGIGSASASWLGQLQAASGLPLSVLAWDAPGYGKSSPVTPTQPLADDYARRLWNWLDTLGVQHPVTLAGHSLGAIMATAAAKMQPHRVERLVLLAPARGYGNASAAERDKKRDDRLQNLVTLGPAGMAQKRGAAMLSPTASAAHIAFIQGVMAQINPAGYTQATHLLAQADLMSDLTQCRCPVAVASGHADTITPEAACREVAAAAQVPWVDLGVAGHACPLEAAGAVNTILGLPAGELP